MFTYPVIVRVKNTSNQRQQHVVDDTAVEAIHQQEITRLGNMLPDDDTAQPGDYICWVGWFQGLTHDDLTVAEDCPLTPEQVADHCNYGWDLKQRIPVKQQLDPDQDRSPAQLRDMIVDHLVNKDPSAWATYQQVVAKGTKAQLQEAAKELGLID